VRGLPIQLCKDRFQRFIGEERVDFTYPLGFVRDEGFDDFSQFFGAHFRNQFLAHRYTHTTVRPRQALR
jgi:hypothetical protein